MFQDIQGSVDFAREKQSGIKITNI